MPFADRLSSLDTGYIPGDLSIFPVGRDSYDTMYQATNNAESFLTQSLTYTGRFLVVDDTSKFPSKGLIRVGKEIVYYASKTNTVFKDIKRGFVGSQQRPWPVGTKVMGSVMAEHHNSVRDAVLNIESNLGVKETPAINSLNGILKELEYQYLAPKPVFRAVPRKGPPVLNVRFQNFSDGPAIRFLWDFGDGSTSVERNPTHTYLSAGVYTVTLSMITSLGATGIATKNQYIVVDEEESLAFFYVVSLVGDTNTEFEFVDQTKGNIATRYWIWDDGTNFTEPDPDIHTATHTYDTAGRYQPTLLVVFADGTLKRVSLNDTIIVTE
jgi:PKD repeat protein